MIRVVIVDDSATMRALIRAVLSQDPELEVVGEAADPLEAREAIKRLTPDVITLDVEMPHMNGLEFLEKIMRLRPMPVVMISTLTLRGAEATLEALELGAVDCIAKPVTGGIASFDGLAEKVRSAARANVRPRQRTTEQAKVAPDEAYLWDGKVVAIGASTGGVEALLTVLGGFPVKCPPTVVTQHMPATFTRSFAERLDRQCRPTVQEASDGMPVAAGNVYIAPGGYHLELTGTPDKLRCRLTEAPPVSGHRPSVDVLFRSVAQRMGRKAAGLILTGMGRDGAEGLLALREAGARTFGQDEASSVVYGMPRVAYEIGAVERQAPLEHLARNLLSATDKRAGASSPETV